MSHPDGRREEGDGKAWTDVGDYRHLPDLSPGHAMRLRGAWPTPVDFKQLQMAPGKTQTAGSHHSVWDMGRSQVTSQLHPSTTLQRQEHPALCHHVRAHQDREKRKKNKDLCQKNILLPAGRRQGKGIHGFCRQEHKSQLIAEPDFTAQ